MSCEMWTASVPRRLSTSCAPAPPQPSGEPVARQRGGRSHRDRAARMSRRTSAVAVPRTVRLARGPRVAVVVPVAVPVAVVVVVAPAVGLLREVVAEGLVVETVG